MSKPDASIAKKAVVNVNVGILGHVDSGKTSLVKALSTSLSTASLDKNPQSQARGITLDLGFSSYHYFHQKNNHSILSTDHYEMPQLDVP